MNAERTGSEPVAVGTGLEELALAARDRLREQGRFQSTEEPPVDWTTGDGQARLDWLLRLSGVPDEYRQVSIEKCRIRREIEDLVQDPVGMRQRGGGAIVFGPVGTGKSSTAALVVGEFVKHKMKARWEYLPDLCDQMLDTYKRQQVLKMQMAPDLLVWDDFAVRPLSDFEIGILDQIVDGRYRRRKPMLVTR